MAKSNPFDAIAKPKSAAAAKTSKIAAVVTDAVKAAVDAFIRIKAEVARLEAEQKDHAETIRDSVRPQQDKLAYSGTYSKSFEVAGTAGNVLYTTTDRFSVPKEEDAQEALKTLLGNKFDEFFENKRTIVFKNTAAENKVLMTKIEKALTAAGLTFADVFEVTDALAAKPDLDRKQYELNEAKLAEFRTLCKQYSASIK